MIRPPSKIQRQKINRHSSQLAIKKLSNSRTTSPKQNIDPDLNKIRRTSFWMKKTICSQGIQNLVPNQSKKPGSARSRKVLSMKINTHTSQADSQFNKNHLVSERYDINSKLVLVEKHQRDVVNEVETICMEKLPKISHCYNLFLSLNKVINMVAKSNLKETHPVLQNILNNHIKSTVSLFERLKNHASEFVTTNKCEDLITKTINLEKQNSQLLNRLVHNEALIKQMKREGIDNGNMEGQNLVSKQFNLNKIDFQRLYMCHSVNYPKLISSKKQFSSSFVCDRLFSKTLAILQNYKQRKWAKFTIINQFIDQFLATKHSFAVFRKFVERDQSKDRTFSFNHQHPNPVQTLTQNAVFDILQSQFDFELLIDIKQSLQAKYDEHCSKKENKSQKSTVLSLLVNLSRFSILQSKQKINQIVSFLIRKVRNTDKYSLTQQQIQEIQKYINEEGYSEQKSRCRPLSDNVNKNEQQINRMKSKRLINCISLFQGKKATKTYSIMSMHKKNGSIFEDQVDEFPGAVETEIDPQTNRGFLVGSKKLQYTEYLLFLYYFCKQQLDFVQKSLTVFLRIDPSENSLNFLYKMVNKRLKKQVQSRYEQQINSIGKVSGHLIRAYGYSKSLIDEAKQTVSQEIIKVMKSCIIR